MGFNLFLNAIRSPALRDVARHWNHARDGHAMPGWSRIDPAAIARHLAIIWSWKFNPATDEFVGRLAGEHINQAFGKSLRGARMADFFAPDQFEGIYSRHRRVVREPCFAHGVGAVFIHADRYGEGERIIMPLGENGTTADGIIGATEYRFVDNAPFDHRPASEQVTFFPIAHLSPA